MRSVRQTRSGPFTPRIGGAPAGVFLAMCALLLGAAGCGGDTADSAPPAEVVQERPTASLPPRGLAWVIFGSDTVRAEVARTSDERARGLMYREELADGAGMLFVFEGMGPRSFWMQNTYIPLDIAFLDADGVVVDIQPMEPLDETFTESAAPAMFALEVPQGWFAARGIEVGARATMVFGAG